jgi:hypothetical protein
MHSSIYSIIVISYLMFCRISMQMCVYDVFAIRLSSFACYNTVSYYDTTLTSFFINYCAILAF